MSCVSSEVPATFSPGVSAAGSLCGATTGASINASLVFGLTGAFAMLVSGSIAVRGKLRTGWSIGTYNVNTGAAINSQFMNINAAPNGLFLVPVPEPSTYAMALAALACGGSSLFRRRRARTTGRVSNAT